MSNGSEHIPERSTDLAGATTRGPWNCYPANAGEFAARWNAKPEEERDEWVRFMVREAQEAERADRLALEWAARVQALADERDALQQRIDAALFQVTGMEELYPREMVADTLRGKTR